MRLYHYTEKENVFSMIKNGIAPGSYWCKSKEDCEQFLKLYMRTGKISNPCEIAFISIEFAEHEITESHDHNKAFIPVTAYYCPGAIDKNRIPKLIDIPLITVWLE